MQIESKQCYQLGTQEKPRTNKIKARFLKQKLQFED